MRAVHFGAGNIGRGFVGEILYANNFSIEFVDINEMIIDSLNTYKGYTIELADKDKKKIQIKNVSGINSKENPESVIRAIAHSDLVTTSIGPNVLPHIAELIAKGINKRRELGESNLLDVIACENMIDGSHFLCKEVKRFLSDKDLEYLESQIGFPNAAVDRIVPLQQHTDPLFVSVEPFSEWVIDKTQSKSSHIQLCGVDYVDDLSPYIERKLFSVNTGHATVAYTGALLGYQTIIEAINNERVLNQLKLVLEETSNLLISKWSFDREEHQSYIEKIIDRFKNPYISDNIDRVARTPIRKLGYNERFIRPIRELKERNLNYEYLIQVVAMILKYDNPNDEQSVKIKQLLATKNLEDTIYELTSIDDPLLKNDLIAACKIISF